MTLSLRVDRAVSSTVISSQVLKLWWNQDEFRSRTALWSLYWYLGLEERYIPTVPLEKRGKASLATVSSPSVRLRLLGAGDGREIPFRFMFLELLEFGILQTRKYAGKTCLMDKYPWVTLRLHYAHSNIKASSTDLQCSAGLGRRMEGDLYRCCLRWNQLV